MAGSETKKTDWKRLKISASLISALALFINLLTLPQNSCLAENSTDTAQNQEEAKEHFNKGVDLQNAGFLNQALAEYKTARSLDDKMEEALGNSGIIYAEQKSYKHATEMFEAALRIKPNSPTVLNALGSVLYSRDKEEEAKEKWKQAIEADQLLTSIWPLRMKQNADIQRLSNNTR
jgi:Tfp pilus assembly protein PilF